MEGVSNLATWQFTNEEDTLEISVTVQILETGRHASVYTG